MSGELCARQERRGQLLPLCVGRAVLVLLVKLSPVHTQHQHNIAILVIISYQLQSRQGNMLSNSIAYNNIAYVSGRQWSAPN